MKYIKKYESSKYNGKYWLLPTDSRFAKSLKDVHCKEKLQFIKNSQIFKRPYVFLIETKPNLGVMSGWGWNPYYGKIFDEHCIDNNIEFCGLINMNIDDDPGPMSQLNEYELNAKSKNYNL